MYSSFSADRGYCIDVQYWLSVQVPPRLSHLQIFLGISICKYKHIFMFVCKDLGRGGGCDCGVCVCCYL